MDTLSSQGYRGVSIDLTKFICDAPAREFLKCVKGHGAYYACERCTVKGVYVNGCVRLIDIESPLRTDVLFANNSYDDHQKEPSPLVKLNFPLVSGFILDPMHLVYLGICKKLLTNWKTGRQKLSQTVTDDISADLNIIAGNVPSNFQRASRTLNDIDKWKAAEYRLFLIYIGPVVLKDHLPTDHYNLFMLLSVAMIILSSESLCCQTNKVLYAKELLKKFFVDTISVFGEGFVTYNFHCVVHLADDVLRFHKSLDELSAFFAENFFGHMVKDVRGSKHPVQQVVRRYREKSLLPQTMTTEKPRIFRRLPAPRDRVFYLGRNRFAIICRVLNPDHLKCKIISCVNDWYTAPLKSTELHYCYRASLSNLPTEILGPEHLTKQAFMIPVKDQGFVFTPLVHHL